MKKLKADALAQQTAAAQQAERERQFGVATNAGWAAYRTGNLTNAIAEAGKALAIHGDDAGMKKLKAGEVGRVPLGEEEDERAGAVGRRMKRAWATERGG